MDHKNVAICNEHLIGVMVNKKKSQVWSGLTCMGGANLQKSLQVI